MNFTRLSVSWGLLCFLSASSVFAQTPAEYLYPTQVIEEGKPILFRWEDQAEAELQFTIRRLKFEGPIKLIETTCQGAMKPKGTQKLNLVILDYTARWTKHKDPGKIGKLVHRGASVVTQQQLHGVLSGPAPELKEPTSEEFSLAGFPELMNSTTTPNFIPKVVVEINNSTNRETGENEFAPIMSWAFVEIGVGVGGSTQFLRTKSTSSSFNGFQFPITISPLGETMFTIEQGSGENAETCQVRIASSATTLELQNAFEAAPVEQIKKPAVFLSGGVHELVRKNLLTTFLFQALKETE